MSKNYDVTVKWHTPEDPTIRETVVKTWASSPKRAEKIGLRGAHIDGTLPADAIIDAPANEPLSVVRMLPEESADPWADPEEEMFKADWHEEKLAREAAEALADAEEEGELDEVAEAPAESITDGEGDMPDIFPPGTRVIVHETKRKRRTGTVDHRVDAAYCRVKVDGPYPSVLYRYNQLSLDDGSAPVRPTEKPPRKPRAAPSGDRKPSKASELDARAATGAMPNKPVMTSAANPHYQKRFDKLEALAEAADWAGVRAYQVKGINSYAKMVAAYRDRLLAAHEAQQRKTEAA